VILRFIEYMDVGATNQWQLDEVVPSAEIARTIGERWAIEPVDAAYRGEVAARYRYLDDGGEIGFISSVTEPFCHDCTRARLSAEGKLYTCLFASRGHDLRAMVRGELSDAELDEQLRGLWRMRADRYSELRAQGATVDLPKVEMSHIGG
jgi:cyclic pyranopterin phosphate synthase